MVTSYTQSDKSGLGRLSKKKKKKEVMCDTASLDAFGSRRNGPGTESDGGCWSARCPGQVLLCPAQDPSTGTRDSCLRDSTSVCYPLCLRDPPSQKQGRGCQRPPAGGY